MDSDAGQENVHNQKITLQNVKRLNMWSIFRPTADWTLLNRAVHEYSVDVRASTAVCRSEQHKNKVQQWVSEQVTEWVGFNLESSDNCYLSPVLAMFDNTRSHSYINCCNEIWHDSKFKNVSVYGLT